MKHVLGGPREEPLITAPDTPKRHTHPCPPNTQDTVVHSSTLEISPLSPNTQTHNSSLVDSFAHLLVSQNTGLTSLSIFTQKYTSPPTLHPRTDFLIHNIHQHFSSPSYEYIQQHTSSPIHSATDTLAPIHSATHIRLAFPRLRAVGVHAKLSVLRD